MTLSASPTEAVDDEMQASFGDTVTVTCVAEGGRTPHYMVCELPCSTLFPCIPGFPLASRNPRPLRVSPMLRNYETPNAQYTDINLLAS